MSRPLTSVLTAAAMVVVLGACGPGQRGLESSNVGTAAPATSAPASPVAPGTSPSASSPPGAVAGAAAADWTTYDHDSGRSGVSPSTPAPGKVSESWTAHVDGDVYAQPLVVGSTVIVATEDDRVYALDATTGRTRWTRALASPVPGGDLPCGDINPSGITGTPVADLATGRLWVVTFSLPFHHTLWELDLSTGAVVSDRAVDGPGSDPRAEQERGALALDGSRVYVPFGGLDGDCSDYHGWVVGAPISGHGPLVSYVTPTQREAGIWAPPGPVVGHSSLYVATGNGTPYAAVDDSDSVVRLSPTLKVESTFTPSNFEMLSSDDLDLGATSPALLPGDLAFMIGKQGVGYLLDATRLGGVGHDLASAQVCSGGFGGDAVDGDTVVVSCYDGLYAVRVTPASSGRASSFRVLWKATGITPGPPIIAGGVVWDVTRGAQLVGFSLAGGAPRLSAGTAGVDTSFPSLSASGDRLFVPEGAAVVSYRGV